MEKEKSRAEILGANLRRIREEKGVSRKQLADAVSLTENLIGLYETGRRLPPLDKILNLADSLETSIIALTGDTPYNPDFPSTDKQIFNYRLQRAMFMAHDAEYYPTIHGDGSLTISVPVEVVTDEETGVVSFKHGFNPIKFKNTTDFVKVMEQAETDAISGNITFNEALRKLLFKENNR